MSEPTIRVMYSCKDCGANRRPLLVRAREEESVSDWMEKTLIVSIAADHRANAPLCVAEKMTEVLIPMGGTDRVGGVPRQ